MVSKTGLLFVDFNVAWEATSRRPSLTQADSLTPPPDVAPKVSGDVTMGLAAADLPEPTGGSSGLAQQDYGVDDDDPPCALFTWDGAEGEEEEDAAMLQDKRDSPTASGSPWILQLAVRGSSGGGGRGREGGSSGSEGGGGAQLVVVPSCKRTEVVGGHGCDTSLVSFMSVTAAVWLDDSPSALQSGALSGGGRMLLSSTSGTFFHLVVIPLGAASTGGPQAEGGRGAAGGHPSAPRLPFLLEVEEVSHSSPPHPLGYMLPLPLGPGGAVLCLEAANREVLLLQLIRPEQCTPHSPERAERRALPGLERGALPDPDQGALPSLERGAVPGPDQGAAPPRLELLWRLPQLGPVRHLAVGDLIGEGRPQLYAVSTDQAAPDSHRNHPSGQQQGGGQCSLTSLSASLPTSTLLAYVPPPGGSAGPAPSRALPLATSPADRHHSLLLLSYPVGSRVLQLLPPPLTATGCDRGQQQSPQGSSGGCDGPHQQQPSVSGGCMGLERVRDVSEELGLDVGEPTLACGLILEGYIAQVRGQIV